MAVNIMDTVLSQWNSHSSEGDQSKAESKLGGITCSLLMELAALRTSSSELPSVQNHEDSGAQFQEQESQSLSSRCLRKDLEASGPQCRKKRWPRGLRKVTFTTSVVKLQGTM